MKAFPKQHSHQVTFQAQIRNSILGEVIEAISLFRKHGTTLGCVYDKSFEINTGGIQEEG